MKHFRLAIATLLLACSSFLNAQVLINEFMAANSSTITDEFGGYPDWIEIRNLTGEAIDLGGWYITDSIPDLTKHMISVTRPDSTTIPAYGFIILWADSKKSQGVRHVDFKLSKSGEQIALSRLIAGTLTIIDSVTFKDQVTDLSYGRERGTNKWIYMNQPTPGAANLPLAVSTHQNGMNINAWPNPTTGSFSISSNVAGSVKLRIIDMQGREIISEAFGNNEINSGRQYDFTSHAPGLYRILLTSSEGTTGISLILNK